jgi:DNA-binding NarL/FixJ family response regulator
MKILLVEDEEGIAIYIKTIMEPHAELIQHVKTLAGCREAVKKEQFDVILLDLNLEDAPAPLTLTEIANIKEAQPHAALIVNTGMGEKYAKGAKDAGADFVIDKQPESMERKAFCAAIFSVMQSKGSLSDRMEMLRKVAEA